MPLERRIIITATYKTDAKKKFLSALEIDEFKFAMKGLASFRGNFSGVLKEGETYIVNVTVFGFIRITGYKMFMERIDRRALEWQSREAGGMTQRWDHFMYIKQDREFAVWTDDVTIQAGWLTPVLARYGVFMYKRRHRRRLALKISSKIVSSL